MYTLANRLAGKAILVIFLESKGFPYRDQTDELFIEMITFPDT